MSVLEGLVSSIIEISQVKEEPLTTATVITCISKSLERNCNTRIDLNQETYLAKLTAIRPTVPSTLPISIGIIPKQKISTKVYQNSENTQTINESQI